jgi:hypothetical protein
VVRWELMYSGKTRDPRARGPNLLLMDPLRSRPFRAAMKAEILARSTRQDTLDPSSSPLISLTLPAS